MRTTHPHIITAGHLIDNNTHRPIRLDELDDSQETGLISSPKDVFNQSPDINYNPNHPQIQRFLNRYKEYYRRKNDN